jgi:phage minor structural protein
MEIIGHAHTSILSDKGNVIIDDIKTDELSTGVKSFELEIETSEKEILKLEECCTAGNYILSQPTYEKSLNFRSTPEYYTIIESEVDAINLKIRIYCEDAGLDLLNEIVGEYAADQAYNIAYYINKFAYDSGFEIGTNEIPNLTRTLSWEGESTAAERIASVATQFDNAEISFSFQMRGLKVIHKYINIHKKRGEVKNCTLLVGDHLANLTKTTSVANLATALKVTGGTPEATQEQIDADVEPEPINLVGYKYDDDDVYVGTDGNLYTRKGLATWSRYLY